VREHLAEPRLVVDDQAGGFGHLGLI
jgi:hypothetical protein